MDKRSWIFSMLTKDQNGQKFFLDLFKARQIPIRRYIKIRAEATPYDPLFKEYFLKTQKF